MIGLGYLTLSIHLKNNGIILGNLIIIISGICSFYGSLLLVRVF